MIEKLVETLKSEVGGKIVSQTNLPPDKLDTVFSVIGDVTKKEVSKQMQSGGIDNVMNLFSSKTNNEGAGSLESNLNSGVVDGLVNKLGLTKDMSGNIAKIALPALISMITKKNNATPDDDPSPLTELFGGGRGIVGAAKSILGKFMK